MTEERKYHSINVSPKTKKRFDVLQRKCKRELKRYVSHDEVLKMLLDNWK